MRWRLIPLLAATLALGGCPDPADLLGGEKRVVALDATLDTGPDPLYPYQWHLRNDGQVTGAVAGVDINVEPAWAEGIRGEGSVIAIVDTGTELGHPDLVANALPGASWDYIEQDNDPTPPPGLPDPGYAHGTGTAGLAAGRDLNGIGIRGAAPRAAFVANNLIAAGALESLLRHALTMELDRVGVSSNSWGFAPDGYGELHTVTPDWEEAIVEGVTYGRGGRGTVYVWAAGNGYAHRVDGVPVGANVDNSNYDDQANSPYIVTTCAVRADGRPALYSERGANLWVCAPGGERIGTVTTDLTGASGNNPPALGGSDLADPDYTATFVGTSAATPLVAGVAALILDANPALTWRDVRLILAQSAVRLTPEGSPSATEWVETTPAPGQPRYHFNHNFGFGLVDAAAAVALARQWRSVGGMESLTIRRRDSTMAVVEIAPGQSAEATLELSDELVIEYLEIFFDAAHTGSGDMGEIEVTLIAPGGSESLLAERHDCYSMVIEGLEIDCTTRYSDNGGWTFGSARHLGEAAAGTWRLTVTNHSQAETLAWNGWGLTLYGRAP